MTIRDRVHGSFSGLTPRELEIFKLFAHGLSNAEIADTLVLAGATGSRA